MKFQIRKDVKSNYQMLLVVHECCLRLQVEALFELYACARNFCSVGKSLLCQGSGFCWMEL